MATSLGWRLTAPLRDRGVVVLMYHRINAGADYFPGLQLAEFRSQMAWVKTHCTPIWPEEIFDAVRYATRIRPPVVITFDDGYRDYHDCAYPVLQDLHIPAVVFLATQFMDGGGLIWTDEVHWAAMATRKTAINLPWCPDSALSLATPAERCRFVTECKMHLKRMPDSDRRRWVATMLEELDVPPVESRLGRQMLDWKEVRACLDGTRFGGHSHTHPILSQTEPPIMEREIQLCRDRIAQETGTVPTTFAYPNGQAGDFDHVTRALLKRYGFQMAFSTIEGINGPDADPLALCRTPTGAQCLGDFATLVGWA